MRATLRHPLFCYMVAHGVPAICPHDRKVKSNGVWPWTPRAAKEAAWTWGAERGELDELCACAQEPPNRAPRRACTSQANSNNTDNTTWPAPQVSGQSVLPPQVAAAGAAAAATQWHA